MYDAIAELRKIPVRPYLRIGSTGWWVRMLCQCLKARGLDPDVRDEFDDNMEYQVKVFQVGHGLKPDGVVGPKTWAELAEELEPAEVAVTGDEQIRAGIVTVARHFESLGIREARGKNNTGPAVEWFIEQANGHPGDPWCVAFAYSVVRMAYATLDQYPPADMPSLSCSALVNWGRQHKRVNDLGRMARPGDLYVLRGGATGYKHVGVVVGLEGKPDQPGFKLITVEGNTNQDGSPDGDGVYLKKRPPEKNEKGLGVAVRVS